VRRVRVIFAVASALLICSGAAQAQTLKKVRERGALICGVTQGLPGFSNPDDKGNWTGFDVDFCRAMAAAIFSDASKVKFSPLSAKDRFTALQSGEIDVLARVTSWTLSRDTALGFNFAAVTYYDGQGFLIRKASKVNSALELNGASICTQTGTTSELNISDFFRTHKIKYELVAFATADEVVKAYDTGRCDVFSTDLSQLYAERLKLTNPNDHMILPEIISKEPLAPVVRHGDDQWLDIARWTHFAMVNAEELGVSSKNIAETMKSERPDVMRLVGTEGSFGEQLGLSKGWAEHIVRLVGNYGEVYERNLGSGSRLAIARGVNNLWNKGGLQYAPPIR
jgi:general L-amino acid transport system substrate-binding protein